MKRVKRGDIVRSEFGIGTVTNVFKSTAGVECADLSNSVIAVPTDKLIVAGFECPDCGRLYHEPMGYCPSDDCPGNEDFKDGN